MRRLVAVLAFAFGLWASPARANDVPVAAYRLATEGRFEEAAAVLEREAATVDDVARASAWRELALTYRIALGDLPNALRDARALGSERAAEAELEAAEVLTRAGRTAERARFHTLWLRRNGGAGARLRGRALVALGDAQRAAGDEASAAATYRRAVMLGGSPGAEAWEAAARFWVAEVRYRAFMARRLPRFLGGNRRAYDQWVQRTLTPFIADQITYLNGDATRAYSEVVNLHVARWEVAAYYRLASMFYRFAEYVRTSPPPPDIARVPELLEQYRRCGGMRDCWAQPEDVMWAHDREGYQRCLHTAMHLREVNEFSRACEAELNAIDRGRFPLADEVTPTPDQGL